MITNKPSERGSTYFGQIGLKAAQKVQTLPNSAQDTAAGSGIIGLAASVAIPSLLGVTLGMWLDNRHFILFPCTPTLFAVGIALGFINSRRWMMKQEREFRMEQEENGN